MSETIAPSEFKIQNGFAGVVNVSVESINDGPAKEIVSLLEKAGAKKSTDSDGNPTYESGGLRASSNVDGPDTRYQFSVPMTSVGKKWNHWNWSLETKAYFDSAVTPVKYLGDGTALMLDSESSQLLYKAMADAGLTAKKSLGMTTYQGVWSWCRESVADKNTLYVCFIGNVK